MSDIICHHIPQPYHPALIVTAWRHGQDAWRYGDEWNVRFICRDEGGQGCKLLDKHARWLGPLDRWGIGMGWSPTNDTRLIPPAALAVVEAWLQEQGHE